MSRFSTQVRIDASKEKVWEVLADLGGIYKWNPGVVHSHSTSDSTEGEGAMRHCDLQRKGDYLEERAFDWREGEGYKIDIYETNLPLKRNIVEFTLEADGEGTIVTVTPDYELKFGPIGVLLDKLFAGRQLRTGMADLLAGLKYHVETGELVDDKVPTA
ncbi:MAG: SRPBCC family protein [Chloroflexi bacterium]|nr:SRPBCC family protein [Chloroflexota bacterium]